MLNQGIITGRLTKDVELKKVNDRSVVSFTLASSRDYKTEEGAYPADFIDCVLWGECDIICAKAKVNIVISQIQVLAPGNWLIAM